MTGKAVPVNKTIWNFQGTLLNTNIGEISNRVLVPNTLIENRCDLSEISANMMATHVSDLSAPLGSGDGQGLRDTGGALGALSHAL